MLWEENKKLKEELERYKKVIKIKNEVTEIEKDA